MIYSRSFVHQRITKMSALHALALVLGGVLAMSLLAQVRIYLPFSPVPVTGQTFGVALIALVYGSHLAIATFGSYLFIGALGAPVFAGLSSLSFGPTLGYLVGMMFSTMIIGYMSDRGLTKTWPKAFLACVLGSLAVFSWGLFGLSYFLPSDLLLASGLLPFLAGDLFKNTLASFLATRIYKI